MSLTKQIHLLCKCAKEAKQATSHYVAIHILTEDMKMGLLQKLKEMALLHLWINCRNAGLV